MPNHDKTNKKVLDKYLKDSGELPALLCHVAESFEEVVHAVDGNNIASLLVELQDLAQIAFEAYHSAADLRAKALENGVPAILDWPMTSGYCRRDKRPNRVPRSIRLTIRSMYSRFVVGHN